MSQPSHLKGVLYRCLIRLIRHRFAYEEMRILALKLILAFSCELRILSNVKLDVIINGDSPVPTVVVEGAVQPVAILSADQKLARRNELKAREKCLGGNTKTKKVQKTLLKQQFKNFTGSSFEDLDQIHDRLQKLVSQLEIHGVSLSQEDVNLKFLHSLPSEWKTHTLIWRNKANLEEHSLRIYKAEVKNFSSLSNPTQNIAFVSSSNTDITTDSVSVATSVFAIYAQLPVSSHPNIDFLSNAIDVDDLKEMDLRWQMAMLTMRAWRKGHFARECRSSNDTRRTVAAEPQRRHVPSYQAEEEPANFALMAIPSSSSASDNESDSESLSPSSLSDRSQPSDEYHVVPPPITGNFMPPKPDLVFHTALIAVVTAHSAFNVQLSPTKFAQEISHATRPMAPIIKDWPVEASILDDTSNSTSSKTNGRSKRKNIKTCFVCRDVDHLIKDCKFYAKPKTQPTPRNSVHRGYDKQYASSTKKYPQKHIVPAAVLTKSKPVSVTAARPAQVVNAAKGKKGKLYMIGNMSYLSDFQELNGGYVAFGGNPKG
nr:hypothetical protein [Tanacetum cinerariifolium]